jgi:hypothetical protein
MAYAKAEVAKNLIKFLESQDSVVEMKRKQIDKPEANYEL